MIYRLWLTLRHFFNFNLDMNVNYLGSSSGQTENPTPAVIVIHRFYRVRGGEDYFLTDVLIPSLLALNVPFEIIGFPALFSKPHLKIIDWIETIFMALGLEKWRPSYLEVMGRFIKSKPTHVIFNNFIPTISLATPELAKKHGAQTFYWVHNSRLACANGLSFNGKLECHKCREQGSHWAFLQKCFESRKQGLIYGFLYRKRRVPKNVSPSIDRYVAVSQYTAGSVISALKGIKEIAPIEVVRTPTPELPQGYHKATESLQRIMEKTKKLPKPFFAYVGRVSFEKGADSFVEMARNMPDKGFLLCGEGPLLNELEKKHSANPAANLVFGGFAGPEEKSWIYENAAALIIPSRVPENSPFVISESHPFKTPVVYPPGGGAEEMVKAMGRSGCPLTEFKGQSFPRISNDQEKQDEFLKGLARILGTQVPEPVEDP